MSFFIFVFPISSNKTKCIALFNCFLSNVINFISWKLNYITDNQFKIIDDFIKQVPLFDICDLKVEEVMKNLKFDKKQTWNKNQFILLNDLGSCFITNKVDNAIIKQSLDFIIN